MSLGKCVIDKEEAVAVYPLLPGRPAFCSKHYNQRDAGPFGVDLSGPDDFDIPYERIELVFKPPYNSKTGTWTDATKTERKLSDITDSHLLNLKPWIAKQASKADRTVGLNEAVAAINKEIAKRGLVEYKENV